MPDALPVTASRHWSQNVQWYFLGSTDGVWPKNTKIWPNPEFGVMLLSYVPVFRWDQQTTTDPSDANLRSTTDEYEKDILNWQVSISHEFMFIVTQLEMQLDIEAYCYHQTYSAYLYTHSPVRWCRSNNRGTHSIIFILRSRASFLCSSSRNNFSCVAACWSEHTIASLTRSQSLQSTNQSVNM